MKPYKGIIRISCLNTGRCPRSIRANVEPGCIACTECGLAILDLEGNEIVKTTPEPQAAAPLKAKAKTKTEKNAST